MPTRRFATAVLVAGSLALAAGLSVCLAASGSDWTKRALARVLSAPLGLPRPEHPPDNPPTEARIELGRKLFFDRRLSRGKTLSCAMCHVPEQGFTSNELATPVGDEGQSIRRNSPSLLNVAYFERLFHDGRESALETQYILPLTASNEMANPSVGYVIEKLKRLRDYDALFGAAFGAGPSADRIGQALAAYQRTLIAGASRFDRWKYGAETDALTGEEIAGYRLFTGRAGCASCHVLGETHALFTDGAFHDTGYGWRREQERQGRGEPVRVELAPGVYTTLADSVIRSVGDPRPPDLGRYEVTLDPRDRWAFRTPTLRNVALTAPYMHDGGLRTLAEVIAFYNGGGVPHRGIDPRIRPLGLDAAEVRALTAFLNALTAGNIATLIAEARTTAPDNPR